MDLQEVLSAKKELQQASVGQRMVYLFFGLMAAAVPVLLYTSVLGLSLDAYAAIFAVVLLFNAVVISLAYHNVQYTITAGLVETRANYVTVNTVRSGKRSDVDEAKSMQKGYTRSEATAFSILYNNVLYVLVASALTFYILPAGGQSIYGYVISSSASAAFITLVSARGIK